MLYVLIPIANIYYYAQRDTPPPPDQTINAETGKNRNRSKKEPCVTILDSHSIKPNKNNNAPKNIRPDKKPKDKKGKIQKTNNQ